MSHIIKHILPLCHSVLSAARMLLLPLRCVINYLILVKLGSHHLWSGSTLTFLLLLWEWSRRMACKYESNCNAPDSMAVLLYRGLIPHWMWPHFKHWIPIIPFQRSCDTQPCQDNGETDCQNNTKTPKGSRLKTNGSEVAIWKFPGSS